jgi:hypothetical protein
MFKEVTGDMIMVLHGPQECQENEKSIGLNNEEMSH